LPCCCYTSKGGLIVSFEIILISYFKNLPSPKLFLKILMKIKKNSVVAITYTLKNDEGVVLDSSVGKESLYYLHGNGNLVIGLENELEDKAKGDKFSVSIPAEKGYGNPDAKLVQQVPLSAFGTNKVEVGMQFHAEGQHGQVVVTVTDITGDQVTVDGNHPLAGSTLHFDVVVDEVREATAEEIAHGHVHGPGGHHH
jgi:FKBP-type peptidyl-prolyl cis-trans isomerase SlyD